MAHEPNRNPTWSGGPTPQQGRALPHDDPTQPPKTSSLAPVAAEPTPELPPARRSPDLLPRILSVTLGAAVLSLIAVYAVRHPPRTDKAVAAPQDLAQRDVELVAGVDDESGPDWMALPTMDFAEHWMAARRPAPGVDDVGVRVGATSAGAGFDMDRAILSLDRAQQKAHNCWRDAKIDSITIAVQFVPEGIAITSELDDRALVGEQAASCFEIAFRRATVPAFVGEPTVLRRTLRRPGPGDTP